MRRIEVEDVVGKEIWLTDGVTRLKAKIVDGICAGGLVLQFELEGGRKFYLMQTSTATIEDYLSAKQPESGLPAIEAEERWRSSPTRSGKTAWTSRIKQNRKSCRKV